MTGPREIPRLGELEAEVMRQLWRRTAPATVREVADELPRERPLAYTTVMTVLDNLHRKGWLRRELDGRAYRYEPAIAEEEYSAELMRQALGPTTDQVAAFTHFLQRMSPDEVEALLQAYRQLAREAERPELGPKA